MGNSSTRSAGNSNGCSKTTIVTDMVTLPHVLEIKGYSVTKGLGVRKSIDSCVFSVADHNWFIAYYPDGFDASSTDCISVFLYIKNPVADAVVKARFGFSLLNQAGEPVSKYSFTGNTHVFSSKSVGCGYHRFIQRKELESNYLRNDSFWIKCDLTVTKDVVRTETTLAPLPPPDLPRHLGSLLASKVGGDVEFAVDGELFTAHRYVLATRSSVFMAELFGPMGATALDHGPLRVQDMEARVFRCMLHFIYTDSLPEIDAGDMAVMAQHLLVAADRYDLQRLKLICEDMLRSSVNVSIAATTLVLAEQHACHGLKAACFEFLKAPGNLKAVIASDSFQHLKSSCPSLLKELLAQVAP